MLIAGARGSPASNTPQASLAATLQVFVTFPDTDFVTSVSCRAGSMLEPAGNVGQDREPAGCVCHDQKPSGGVGQVLEVAAYIGQDLEPEEDVGQDLEPAGGVGQGQITLLCSQLAAGTLRPVSGHALACSSIYQSQRGASFLNQSVTEEVLPFYDIFQVFVVH